MSKFAIRIDSYVRFERADTHSTLLGRFRRFPQVKLRFGKSYGEHEAFLLSNLSQIRHFEKNLFWRIWALAYFQLRNRPAASSEELKITLNQCPTVSFDSRSAFIRAFGFQKSPL